jgi:hypothetical protein
MNFVNRRLRSISLASSTFSHEFSPLQKCSGIKSSHIEEYDETLNFDSENFKKIERELRAFPAKEVFSESDSFAARTTETTKICFGRPRLPPTLQFLRVD